MGHHLRACFLCVFLLSVSKAQNVTTESTIHGIPSGAALDKIVQGSFHNVDGNGDGFLERYEFDTLVIVADSDNDGCMTLDEYKGFTAGTPEIASKIYKHFDPDNTNCLTVDKVASQFQLMDKDGSGEVDPQEFAQYYLELLKLLYSTPDNSHQDPTVG